MNDAELKRIEDEAKAGKAHPADVLELMAEIRRLQEAAEYRLAKKPMWA